MSNNILSEVLILRADRKNLHGRVRELRSTITSLMAKLADLLDEDHFHACEAIVTSSGVFPPSTERPTDAQIRAALLAFNSGDMDWESQDEELMRLALEAAFSAWVPE